MSGRPGHRSLDLDLPGGRFRLDLAPGLEDLADELAGLWAHRLASDDGPPTEVIALRPLQPADRAADPAGGPGADEAIPVGGPGASYAVSGIVTRAVIRSLIGQRLLLHAGAVDVPGIGTVLLVGESGAGKSTATERLGRQGTYLTDELTNVEPETGLLEAYPKPVSRWVGEDSGQVKRDVGLGDLGLVPGRSGGPVDHVLLLDRERPERDGAVTAPSPSLTRVPLDAAVVELIAQSSSVWELARPLDALARLLERAGGALRARYTESADLAQLLTDLPPPLREPWETIDPDPDAGVGPCPYPGPALGPESTGAPGRWAPAPFRQALSTSGATVVLLDGLVLRLEGLGELIWHLLADGGPLAAAEIEQQVITRIGEHPRASDLVAAALGELERSGAVGRR